MPQMPELKSPFAGELSKDDAARTAKLLDAVSNPSRLRIVSLLAEHGTMTGTDLIPALGVTQPTISHHMRILARAGLVRWVAEGVWVRYTLDREAFGDLARLLSPGRRS